MSSVVLSGDTSGAVTVAVPAVAGTNTVTIAAQTGTLNAAGPAFYAYRSANQTGVSANVHTKVQLNAELFDTNNNFDSSTNYRFTPTVAGYYQINWAVNMSGTALTYSIGEIYKNGTLYQYGSFSNNAGIEFLSNGSTLVYMNGTTDYLELYLITSASGTVSVTGVDSFRTFMSGSLVRGA
jgi:hypothetical protein